MLRITRAQIEKVQALIEMRRLTTRSRTTWEGDTRGQDYNETTEALSALVALAFSAALTNDPSLLAVDKWQLDTPLPVTVQTLARAGRTLDAVRLLRHDHDIPLKDAKAAVDLFLASIT